MYALNAQLSPADLADAPLTGFPARACRFDIKLTVIPSSLAPTNASQLATSGAPSNKLTLLPLVACVLAIIPLAAFL